jgi:hypothetical protein
MSFWTPERDNQLRLAEAAGLSAAEIAGALGTTRSAVLGRFARLRKIVFQSSLERAAKDAAAREARALAQMKAIETMAIDLAQDMSRPAAMRKAHPAGATWKAIGGYFNITRQAAHDAASRTPAAKEDVRLHTQKEVVAHYNDGKWLI